MKRCRTAGRAIVAATIVSLLATGCGGSSKAGEGKVKIGALVTLTGDLAVYGIPYRNGMKLAIEQHNEASDYQVEFIERNPAEDPAENISAIRQFDAQGVDFLLNTQGSPSVMASGPVANRNEQLMIVGATASTIPEIGPWVWQGPQHTATLGSIAMADIVEAQGAKTVTIIKVNSDYGVSGGEEVTKALAEKGIEVVDDIAVAGTETDFGPVVSSARRSNADAYVLYFGLPAGPLIARQLRAAGVDAPIIGPNAWVSPDFAEVLPDADAEKIFAVVDFLPTDAEPGTRPAQFIEAYEEAYDIAPDTYAASGYDQASMMLAAMDAVHEAGDEITPDNVREALAEVTIDGALGEGLHFGENRSIVKDVLRVSFGAGTWTRMDSE